MAPLPSHFPDQKRRKHNKKPFPIFTSKKSAVLLLAFCFFGFVAWKRSGPDSDYQPSVNLRISKGRRDLKEQYLDSAGVALYARNAHITTFPALDDARRVLICTHNRLAWYNYETDQFNIIHEGEGVYYGGFPGDELDSHGRPQTIWVVSRPHNWRPTTSKEWILQLNAVTGEVTKRVPLPSRFTHDTVRTGNRVYAADTGEGHILELDFPSMDLLRRMELYSLKEHVNTLSVPSKNGTMWAMLHNLGPSVLSEIDLAGGQEIRRLPNIGLKSHGAVQWRGESMIVLDSDHAALMRVDLRSGLTTRLWTAPDDNRYLKGLCVIDDIAFFGIAEAQERQSRDSTALNCEIAAFDLLEGVLLWRRQLQTRGLLNVVSAPHIQVESTALAVWVSDPKQSYRATASYQKHLEQAKNNHPAKALISTSDKADKTRPLKPSLLEKEPLSEDDPLVNYPPKIGGHWGSGYPHLDNASKDRSHGLSSGAQLPLFRWDHGPLRDYLLSLPLADWTEKVARKSNAWLQGREGNLNMFKPGTSSMQLIFSDNEGHEVFEFPWYKSRFAKYLDPLLHEILGDDVQNIIRLQFAYMPGHTHIKRHVDRGGYSSSGHRIHLVVASSPDVKFHVCEDETCIMIHVEEGLVFELNNRLDHFVDNDGEKPRIHMVLDVAENPKERTLLKVGQVCDYGGKIIC